MKYVLKYSHWDDLVAGDLHVLCSAAFFPWLQCIISVGYMGFRACKGSFMLYVTCPYEYRLSLGGGCQCSSVDNCSSETRTRSLKDSRDFCGEVNSWWDVLNICMILLPPRAQRQTVPTEQGGDWTAAKIKWRPLWDLERRGVAF